MINFGIARNLPLLAVGLLVVLLALNYYVPNLLGNMEWMGRVVLGVMATAGGIYVIYKSAISGTKIDDILGLMFGAVLIGIGAYMGFGVDIATLLSQFGASFANIVQPVVGASIVFVGMYFLQRRGTYDDFIGVIMIIAGLAVFGISLVNYINQQLVMMLVGGGIAFAGLYLLTVERGWVRLLGIILVLIALSLFGVSIANLFKW